MLTSRGRRTIALGLIAGLGGRILGIPELFGLAAAVVVVSLAALVRVRMVKPTVSLSARAVPEIVEMGDTAALELTIEQSSVGGFLASAIVLVADQTQGPGLAQPETVIVPRLARGERALASFPLPTRRRGLLAVGAYEASVTDPLGLARRYLVTSRAARCVVLPRVEPLADLLPNGAGPFNAASSRPAVERLRGGSSTLRRYAEGDDLRLVHWRTTARVGELMVREGSDPEDPEKVATTVLLDPGDVATPSVDLERAVEVAASVLGAAAETSSRGIPGTFRLVVTDGVDTGVLEGEAGIQQALGALAGVTATRTGASERFRQSVTRLGRPQAEEVLFIVGTFDKSSPDPALLAELGSTYSAVLLVVVGAGCPEDPPSDCWVAPGAGSSEESSSRRPWQAEPPAGVWTVLVPRGRSLAAAWDLQTEERGPVETAAALTATGRATR